MAFLSDKHIIDRHQRADDGEHHAERAAVAGDEVEQREARDQAEQRRELDAFDRSIDVHMGRIRAAIEVDAKNPKRILTVRGVGYVFAKQQK